MKRTGFAPLIIGMYTLPTGLVILLGHNMWAWDWPVFVTIAGWGMTIKATIYLIFPAVPNRMIDNADRWQKAYSVFRVVGAVMSVLGVVLTWHAFGIGFGLAATRGWRSGGRAPRLERGPAYRDTATGKP